MKADQESFATLLMNNKNIVWSICNKYLDDEDVKRDLFQDIAMSAWRSYHLFRNECKFSTWLHRISFRVAVAFVRNTSKKIQTTALDNILYEVVDDDTRYVAEKKDTYSHAMSELSESETKFMLLYAEGYSYAEMEKIFGVPESNLRIRMNRIRQRLKKYDR